MAVNIANHKEGAKTIGIRRPIAKVRKKGVCGIRSFMQKCDPAFDIDGLPNPFGLFFPMLIHNGHTATLYVGAVLVSPPAGYTDSEDQLGSVAAGANLYAEKDNTTRALPTPPLNETITLRVNYYTDAGYSVLLGYDDFAITIYWESVLAGTVDDTDDFETTLEGWTRVDEVGTTGLDRSSAVSVSGAYSMRHWAWDALDVSYLTKTVTMGAGTRAYIFGYVQPQYSGAVRPMIIEIITPVETLALPFPLPVQWRRFGARLNPGVSNQVKLRTKCVSLASDIFYDLIRWIRY